MMSSSSNAKSQHGDDKTASLKVLITGASQGIGAAIARAFASEKGARLALVARNHQSLESVAQECRHHGAETNVFVCDLTVANDVTTMAKQVHSTLGVPDILINNAGKFVRGDLLSMTSSTFCSVLDANLTSAFLVTQAFVPGMIAQKQGTIIYMASVASTRAYPNAGAYSIAKHGLLGLARSIRESTRESGLRVCAIQPGATNTPSWEPNDIPVERFIPAEDIAQSVLSIYKLSPRTVVEEMILRPLHGDL